MEGLTATLEAQPSLFRDRLVIVGAEFAGAGDEAHRVPDAGGHSAHVTGLVLQSMIVDTILSGLPVREPARRYTLAVLMLVAAIAAGGMLCLSRLWLASFLIAVGVLLWVACCFLFFLSIRTLIPIAGPLISVVVAGAVALVLRLRIRNFPNSGEGV